MRTKYTTSLSLAGIRRYDGVVFRCLMLFDGLAVLTMAWKQSTGPLAGN
jgi:hypothetical protein